MPKGQTRLPFDERNDHDFEEVTRKISDAIATIQRTPSIPATGNKLAQMAGCTRKTLHNRRWPLEKLKEIKERRTTVGRDGKPKKPTASDQLGTEQHATREKLLIAQIRNLQKQNGELFDRVQDLEEQKLGLIDTVKVLEVEIVTLRDENQNLGNELRKAKQSQNIGTNVVDIRTANTTRSSE